MSREANRRLPPKPPRGTQVPLVFGPPRGDPNPRSESAERFVTVGALEAEDLLHRSRETRRVARGGAIPQNGGRDPGIAESPFPLRLPQEPKLNRIRFGNRLLEGEFHLLEIGPPRVANRRALVDPIAGTNRLLENAV